MKTFTQPGLLRDMSVLGVVLVALAAPAVAQSLAWADRYDSGLELRPATPTAIAAAPGGGVAVVAASSNGTSDDLVTARVDANGQLRWSRRFSAAGSRSHEALAVALDGAQNVYALGSMSAQGRLVLVKYDTDGELLWSYVSPGDVSTTPIGIAPDPTGVTLALNELRSGPVEMVIRRFDPAGGVAWEERRPGASAGAVRSMPGGGAVVAATAGPSILTLRYGIDGAEQWARSWRYRPESTDGALGVEVDSSGNVYVDGIVFVPNATPSFAGGVVLKYDTAGTESWSVVLDTPTQMAVTPLGDVWLVNPASGGLTIQRRNTLGQVAWTVTSDGFASLLALDPGTGDGMITGPGNSLGAEPLLMRVAPSGVVRWTVNPGPWMGRAGVVGLDGETTLGDAQGLVRFDAAGERRWTTAGLPAPREERPTRASLDGGGNLVVTLASGYPSSVPSMGLLKYDRSGRLLWARRRDGLAWVHAALGCDAAGNLYTATGEFQASGDMDILVLKYSPGGDLIWARTWDGGNKLEDLSTDLAVDAAGNVVVVGSSKVGGPADVHVLTVVRWNTTGALQWARALSGAAGSSISAEAVALNGEGEIYVASRSILAKYAPDGTLLWSRVTAEIETSVRLAVGSDGRACVAGATSSNGAHDYVTACYAAQGPLLWKQPWRASGSFDQPSSLVVDSLGSVVVTGTTGLGSGHLATIKYDPLGRVLWQRVDPSVGDVSSPPPALSLGRAGQVYVAWNSTTTDTVDYRLTAYDSLGNDLWKRAYTSPSGGASVASAVAADAGERVFVVGQSWGGGATGMDVVTLAYDDGPPTRQTFHTVSPCRVLDTRTSAPLRAGVTVEFAVAGVCGISSTAVAVSANVTVTEPGGAGYLQAWPAGQPSPATSVINHSTAQTRANSALLRLGAAGRLALRVVQDSGAAHVLLDVTGYFE